MSRIDDDDLWGDWFEDEQDNEFDKTEFKYILGIDPGGTTGISIFRYTDEILPELVFMDHIVGGTVGYYDYFFETVLDDNLVVVSEKWVERPGIKNPDHTPCYIEGVQLAQWGINRVIYQTPDQKQMVPDAKLKEQNLWVPNARHAMDATIHVLVYLRSIKHAPTLEALAGLRLETISETDDSKDKFGGGGSGDGDGNGGFDARLRAALAELAEQGDEDGGSEAEAGDEGLNGPDDPNPDDRENRVGKGIKLEQDDGKRNKKRERNGVFIGYAPESGEETELFSD